MYGEEGVFNHFRNRFDKPDGICAITHMEYPRRTSLDKQSELKGKVSNDEIKRAVYGQSSWARWLHFWFLQAILVSLAGVLGDIVNEVQSAFVTDKQILDGPFILNEVIQWCKSKKKQSLVFKVDFEKAYDSVRSDFLDDILGKFGFGDKWRMWIQSCLKSSREEAEMFKGIKIGPTVTLSHMFYADDTVFVGKWCESKSTTLVHVLDCFYRASGFKINMSKSKILRVHVESDRGKEAALRLGCLTLKTPFIYLGSKVGGFMSRLQEWDEVVEQVKMQLSKWKMKSLSIGGRLTLLKSVLGSMTIFNMSIFKVPLGVLRTLESIQSHFFKGHALGSNKASWVSWKKVLSSKDKGGLGVSSLYALNRGMLFKWILRFYTQDKSLWVRVIKAMYGDKGKIDAEVKIGSRSCWLNIVHEAKILTQKEKMRQPSLEFSFRRNTRGGVEKELVTLMHGVSLSPMADRWTWALENSGEFTVSSVRKHIDDKLIPRVGSKTRWIKYEPIKVNVNAWKVKLDALPTRFNVRVGTNSRRSQRCCKAKDCGETAAGGAYPKVVVKTVAKICMEAESTIDYSVAYKMIIANAPVLMSPLEILASSVVRTANTSHASLILVLTPGETSDEAPARHSLIFQGLVVVLCEWSTKSLSTESTEEALDSGMQHTKTKGLCKEGDAVVALHRIGTSSVIKIVTLK
nr:RNA-directed DNA polymerase, eukaryota, reverse transcriptase zinc-binding domain protein [Tanacetum cinerariifolium]